MCATRALTIILLRWVPLWALAAAPAMAARGRDVVVARVDGVAITDAAVERALGPPPRRPTPADRDARTARRPVVLDRLVEQALLFAECRRAGHWPTPAQVAALLRARRENALDADFAAGSDADRTDAVRWRHCSRALVAATVDAPLDEAELQARFAAAAPRSAGRAHGRRWEIDLAGFERLDTAEAALNAAVAAGSPRVAGLGAGLAGDGPSVHAWPLSGDDPVWGPTLSELAPGERTAARRNGDTLVLVERLPGTVPGAERADSFEEARPRLEAQIRRERRAAALQTLLARLRAGARVEVVEARR